MRHLDVVMHMNIVCVIVLGPISLIRFHAPFAIWIAYCFVDECWMNRNSVLCSICNAFCNCKLFDVSYSNKVIWTWTWTWKSVDAILKHKQTQCLSTRMKYEIVISFFNWRCLITQTRKRGFKGYLIIYNVPVFTTVIYPTNEKPRGKTHPNEFLHHRLLIRKTKYHFHTITIWNVIAVMSKIYTSEIYRDK